MRLGFHWLSVCVWQGLGYRRFWFHISQHLGQRRKQKVAAAVVGRAGSSCRGSAGRCVSGGAGSQPAAGRETKRARESRQERGRGERNRCLDTVITSWPLGEGDAAAEGGRPAGALWLAKISWGRNWLFLLRLPSRLAFRWARSVHGEVNSLPTAHKLRMTCLAVFPYMESAVFQYSLSLPSLQGGGHPAEEALLYFFLRFAVRHSNCRKGRACPEAAKVWFTYCLSFSLEEMQKTKQQKTLFWIWFSFKAGNKACFPLMGWNLSRVAVRQEEIFWFEALSQ